MTHPEKLYKILYVLLDTYRMHLEKHVADKRSTFSFICNSVANIHDAKEIEFLNYCLLSNGYMEMSSIGDGEPPEITQIGIEFVELEENEHQRKKRAIKKQIEDKSLKKFQFEIWAIIIALLSLVMALVALFKIN
jgi:hypothetical protein